MIRRLTTPLVMMALIAIGAHPPIAKADGDPGSDVLVYQDLFAGSDAGLTVRQQVQLGDLLKAAAQGGFPLRVAIIASPFDLGAVAGLLRNPRGYAHFLGLELSLAYKQRPLVVMPNGFGFNWPGHSPEPAYRVLAKIPIRPVGGGLGTAAQTAVRTLALASGVRLPAAAQTSAAGTPPAQSGNSGGAAPAGEPGADNTLGTVALALVAIVGVGLVALRVFGRRRLFSAFARLRRQRTAPHRGPVLPVVTVLLALAAVGGIIALLSLGTSAPSQGQALATNPYLDPGTPLSGAAPDFTLSDQFGQPVSLHDFRGKVVILAFNDAECTTMCPLTTTAMLDAKAMLGKAGSRVQLLGIDANPAAISLEDVWSYSELHGMLHAWQFLTGTLPQLKQVWRKYAVEAAIQRGQITHTPALFVIDPQGRKAKVYITQMSYTAVPQLGQLLAREASRLLPGHPAVHSNLSYARVGSTMPSQRASLPRAGGGTVRLGHGASPRRVLK